MDHCDCIRTYADANELASSLDASRTITVCSAAYADLLYDVIPRLHYSAGAASGKHLVFRGSLVVVRDNTKHDKHPDFMLR